MRTTRLLRRAIPAAVFVASVFPRLLAQDDSFWSFLERGQVITPCRPSSSAHARAKERLERLSERITQLRDDEPVKSVLDELHALLRSECLLLASETDRVPAPDSSMSLREWWQIGGSHWVDSLLELPRLGSTTEVWTSSSRRSSRVSVTTTYVVVPPDPRRTLTAERGATHPLRALLCPANDTGCGAATRGWKARADAAFEAHFAMQRDAGLSHVDERPATGPPATARECTNKSGTGAQRYRRWRTCLENRRPQRAVLPLGDFKAPTAGWLIVSGRRGHYEFCDTTSAYDLATGAMFTHDSCSALALKRGGDVDRDATNRARVERVRAGTVPVENLREAVWMLLLRGEAEHIQMRAEYYPLPVGMRRSLTVSDGGDEYFGRSVSVNTGQTSLTWRWVVPGSEQFAGELTWPGSDDAAENHAAALLDVAERGLVERCAPARPPEASALASPAAVRLNDVEADDIDEMDASYRDAVEKWRPRPGCSAGER